MRRNPMCLSRHPSPVARSGASRVLAVSLSLLLLPSCGADEGIGEEAPPGSVPELRQGPPLTLGNGTIRTYLLMDGTTPTELGVAISENALQGLPPDGAPGGVLMPDGHSTFPHVLEMPAGNPTPFDHVLFDWNPAGHEPPGTFDRPHFDVHFYTISSEARMAIEPTDPEFMAKAMRPPPGETLPLGYIDPGMGPVPYMGVHWVDPTSPELHPETPALFTRTFIYGSWDGRIIFAEPMVTVEHLATRPDERIPVGVAPRYDPPGFYPASYLVRWDEGAREYRIALADLGMR